MLKVRLRRCDLMATTIALLRIVEETPAFEEHNEMTTEILTKKRVFIAASLEDAAEVQRLLEDLGLDTVTIEEDAVPGTTWVDSVHRCISEVDVVIGILRDRRKETNVFFQLGVANALNKPVLLFVSSDSPKDLIPPSGIPYLRMDFRNEHALRFGLDQMLSLSPPKRRNPSPASFSTQPIGQVADELLAQLPQADEHAFENLIYEALQASGVSTIARGDVEGIGCDFAIWSSDLEPVISNPLLIECRSRLLNQSNVNEVIGQMLRALQAIPNGWGIVLYKEANVPKAILKCPPVIFVSGVDFLEGLREIGLTQYVRKLRNQTVHGV